VSVPLRFKSTHRSTDQARDATHATRHFLEQWIFALTLFYCSNTQAEFPVIARQIGLLDHARALKKALHTKESAGHEKVDFDDRLTKVRPEIQLRIARFLERVPQADLNVPWLHNFMVDLFSAWMCDQAGLKVHGRVTMEQLTGPTMRGRQRMDRQAIMRRCETYLTAAFGEYTGR
jgi:hypothetical protein